MDSNQTWYEASLVCAHSFLWIWANSKTPKKYHPLLCYLVYCFSAEKCNFGSFITSAYHHGFHQNLVRVTPTMSSSYPVNMSKIWGIKKYDFFFVLSDFPLKSNFGSLITIMNVHGFHPNLTWSIPTVPSFIPVNMSKIWGFKNFTFVLNIFFTQKNFTKYHFYTMCTNYLKNYHKNGLSHLMRHWLHTHWQSEWTHIHALSASPKQVISQKPCEFCIECIWLLVPHISS